jgi:hypothetical protein
VLAFAMAAEAINSRQKIKVQNGGEERRKKTENQKIIKF